MKGWDWRTKERFPNGELLTPREDVEKEWEPFFTPWLIVAIFVMIAVIMGATALRGGGSPTGSSESNHSHSEAGAQASPAEVSAAQAKAYASKHGITNADIRGHYTIADGSIGSPEWYGGNESRLQNGFNRDSRLWISDRRLDGIAAIIYTYGCGRGWTRIDKGGADGVPATRETYCNMQFHQTGQKMPSTGETRWGPPNYHGG